MPIALDAYPESHRAIIDGVFVNSATGKAQDGATAKLWHATAFSTPPAKNTALPASVYQIGSAVTTGTSHGSDGAFRFADIPFGDYYVSIEYNGNIGWQSHRVSPGDSVIRTSSFSSDLLLTPRGRFKGEPWFDVKAYGAVGDGSTDDTAAFEGALAAAISVGGTVFVPTGTFVIDTISTTGMGDGTKPLSIMGVGQGSVIKLKNSATVGAMFFIFPSTVSGLSVSNLMIDGNSANNAGDGVSCFRVHTDNAMFTNVVFVDVVQEAIYHSAGSGGLNSRLSVTNSIFHNAGRYAIAAEFINGMVVGNCIGEDLGAGLVSVETSTVGVDSANDISVVGNTIRNTGAAIANASAGAIGIWGVPGDGGSIVRAVQDVTIANNIIDGAGNSGIVVGNMSSATITGNVIEGAANYGILNSDGGGTLGSLALVIMGNVVRDCSLGNVGTYSGILLQRTTDSIVKNNIISAAAQHKYHIELGSNCAAIAVGGNVYRGSGVTGQQLLGGTGHLVTDSLND